MNMFKYLFFLFKFLFPFSSRNYNTNLTIKNIQNFIYNKLKIKDLKVKVKANRNTNNINEKNNIKNTTHKPRCFFFFKKVINTNVEKFCTCSYILKIY